MFHPFYPFSVSIQVQVFAIILTLIFAIEINIGSDIIPLNIAPVFDGIRASKFNRNYRRYYRW
jgi:hypothetical protein